MSLFVLFKSKEEKESIRLSKLKSEVEKRVKEARDLDNELSFFKNKYHISKNGLIYIFIRIQYDKNSDQIQFATRNGNTPEGMIAVMDASWYDMQQKLSNDKMRFEQFLASSERLGLSITTKTK